MYDYTKYQPVCIYKCESTNDQPDWNNLNIITGKPNDNVYVDHSTIIGYDTIAESEWIPIIDFTCEQNNPY